MKVLRYCLDCRVPLARSFQDEGYFCPKCGPRIETEEAALDRDDDQFGSDLALAFATVIFIVAGLWTAWPK